MSIQFNEKRLFPQLSEFNNPHEAICDATSDFYREGITIDQIRTLFRSVIDTGGIAINYSCFIACEYDWESMEGKGIVEFSPWERCIVGNDAEDHFVWIEYSLAELEGWLALLALSISGQIDENWKRPLIILLGRRFDVLPRLSELHSKLSGITDWDFGPVGMLDNEEDITKWKLLHTESLANEYFKFVDRKFQTNGFNLVSEEKSPISSAPVKEVLFPILSQHKNPHTALFKILEGFLYRFENNECLVDALQKILEGSNYQFDGLGKIFCNYKNYWMEAEGIPQFSSGECYLVESDDKNIQWIMYSKDEFEGWLALVAINLRKKRIRDRALLVDELLNSRFNQISRLDLIRKKLSGVLNWDFGPVGASATSDTIANWVNLHCKELEEDIYSYGCSGGIPARYEKKI